MAVRFSVVYFIAAKSVGLVKIGSTTALEDRFANIQASSPVKLEVAATIQGGIEIENDLHAYFSAYREHGEWFRLVPEIEAFIGQVKCGVWLGSIPSVRNRHSPPGLLRGPAPGQARPWSRCGRRAHQTA